jgi:FixJ family two-component response regulator
MQRCYGVCEFWKGWRIPPLILSGDHVVPAIIHVVDDDASFRKSLSLLLQAAGYEVQLYDSAEQVMQLPLDAGLGCILLDVKMPGLSGPELQDCLNRLGSPLPVIFLSGHANISTTVRAIKAGADDFLTKPIAKADLLMAIERALSRYNSALVVRDQITALRIRLGKLTPRERSVFELVVRGQINKQIAFELGTTARTIKAHRQKVMQKLDAHSLLDLAAMAEKLGFLTSQENHSDQTPRV